MSGPVRGGQQCFVGQQQVDDEWDFIDMYEAEADWSKDAEEVLHPSNWPLLKEDEWDMGLEYEQRTGRAIDCRAGGENHTPRSYSCAVTRNLSTSPPSAVPLVCGLPKAMKGGVALSSRPSTKPDSRKVNKRDLVDERLPRWGEVAIHAFR
jgi:hypothetical protein